MMRKIGVRIEDYKSYTEKYNTYKLDDKNIIFGVDGKRNLIRTIFKLNEEEEILNGIETDYRMYNTDSGGYILSFASNSDTKYRIDLLKETGINIFHIAFSLYDSTEINYDDLTNKNELLEVFNRVVWILKDFDLKINADEFCIGATGTKKDDIYKYMMRFIPGWEKRDTTAYKLGWALYFKLK